MSFVDQELSHASSSDLSTRNEPDEHAIHNDKRSDEPPATYERMVLNDRTYLCSIPILQPSTNETEEVTAQDGENELVRATDRGWQLLQDMHGQCLYYQSGYWSYSFCYQTEVKQFHPLAPPRGGAPSFPPVEDTRVPAFILGEFHGNAQPNSGLGSSKDDSSSGKKKESKESKGGKPNENAKRGVTDLPTELAVLTKGDMRYLSQNLTGGTTCDLTGKPRRVEVQFHCHPQSTDRIGWIKETATCAYLMVIYTPRLCNDLAFLPPKEHETEQIVCREVVAEAEFEKWQARKAADAEKRLLSSSPKVPLRPVVGGIEVGGYKQVPHEGTRIPPPQGVEQIPKEGEIIAYWDPKEHNGEIMTMSDEDLRSIDLDPHTVDQMKDKIHKEAGGRAWRMEIIELVGGLRELVGVIESPDDMEEELPPEGEGSQETYKDEL